LRVLDLSTGVAGPFGAKLLADFGAGVLKVEPPAGDPARCLAPFAHDFPDREASLLFAPLNTNKRSLTLDLTGRAARRALLPLLPPARARAPHRPRQLAGALERPRPGHPPEPLGVFPG